MFYFRINFLFHNINNITYIHFNIQFNKRLYTQYGEQMFLKFFIFNFILHIIEKNSL